MRNIESALDNEILKILWDFKLKTNQPILARGPVVSRPVLFLRKKNIRTCHRVYFAVPADHRKKMKESQNWKKAVEHKSDNDTISRRGPWNSPWEPEKETPWIGNKRKKWNQPEYSAVEIGKDN